jgi:carbon storage regulator
MLVLSRRIGQEIVIAGDIYVTVVAIKGSQVRLGIRAPASIHVARLELLTANSDSTAPGTVGRKGQSHRIVSTHR